MITLTSEHKNRYFREEEKRLLYETLRQPYEEKKKAVEESFKKYIDNNIIGVVLNHDLLEIGEKPYCRRYTTRFMIYPKEFGLSETYIGIPNYKRCLIHLKHEHFSEKYKIAISSGYTFDITSDILGKCSSDVIDQVKYFLVEVAKSNFDYSYFGLGTYIRPNEDCFRYHYSGDLFPGLNTWGKLYSKSPEAFETLCKIKGESDMKGIVSEETLLSKLKFALGY